jgi:cullin-associated NEDD8-dissociated protein 1
VSKTALRNVGACIASLSDDVAAVAAYVVSAASTEGHRVVALYAMGFSKNCPTGVLGTVDNLLLQSTVSEDIRSAAAFTLGNVLTLQDCLARVTDSTLSSNLQNCYTSLLVLREHLASYGRTLDSSSVPVVLGVLQPLLDHEQESVRSMVSECLERCATVDLLHLMFVQVGIVGRSTIVNALRGMLFIEHDTQSFESPSSQWHSLLLAMFSAFERPSRVTSAPADPASVAASLPFRRSVMLLINAAARQRPILLTSNLQVGRAAFQVAAAETARDELLIRSIHMGPVRHEVDDGLELRKLALDSLFTLREAGLVLDDVGFIDAFSLAITDKTVDVASQASRLLLKLLLRDARLVSTLSMSAACLSNLASSLTKALETKAKADSIDQERDRFLAMHYNCLRLTKFLATMSSGHGSMPALGVVTPFTPAGTATPTPSVSPASLTVDSANPVLRSLVLETIAKSDELRPAFVSLRLDAE